MPDELLQVCEQRVEMIVGGRVMATANPDEISRLYLVVSDDPLYHGEEPFYVVLFKDFLWVIPYFTLGAESFLRAVLPRLEARRAIFKAVSPAMPVAWRKKLLGALPLFPVPRLAQHPLSPLPDWQERGPLRLSEIPEFAAGNQ